MTTGPLAMFGVHSDQIIRVIVIVSVLGTIDGIVLVTARGLLAMTRDGPFAHPGTRDNAGGTPTAALLVLLLSQPSSCPGRSAVQRSAWRVALLLGG